MRDFLNTWAWPIGFLLLPVGYQLACWLSDAVHALVRRRRS